MAKHKKVSMAESSQDLLNSQVVSAKVGMHHLVGLNNSVTIYLRHVNKVSIHSFINL